MAGLFFKKVTFWIWLISLLLVVEACISTEPSWKNQPNSKLTGAEIEITSIADILANPDKYDGNIVQIGGWVSSLRFVNSRYGAFTYFHLGDQSGKTISFVSIGILPIKDGDFISVTAKYKKSADLIWVDSIESSNMERK
jgi:hypothetical protein